MLLHPFRDLRDPDEKRREIIWIAISFIVILATWLAVVLIFGYQPLILGMSYDEAVLFTGLGLLVFCTVLYLAAREREQRAANRRLLGQLQQTVARLDERLGQLRGLSATSAELAGALDIRDIARSVVESLTEAVDAAASSLVLVDNTNGKPVYAHHVPSPASAGGVEPLGTHAVWGSLPTGASGAIADLPTSTEGRDDLPTLICAPVPLKNGLSGLLGARRDDSEKHFTPDDVQVLTTLANMAAKAIESAYLHAELRQSYLSTLHSLVNSLDARDNYTAAHGQRVASLATRIAENMGLPESLIHDIEAFGPLHDVGKIGIRDHILLKASPLSEEEAAACREHTVIGERIVRPLKPSRDALSMIRNHHESFDGSGYPDGLVGEDIPILARVLQVADCYDAMVSDRPYQSAMSEQEVLAHFRQFAGTRHDPAAVDALHAVARNGGGRDLTEDSRERSTGSQAGQTIRDRFVHRSAVPI